MTVLETEEEGTKQYISKRGNENFTYKHIIIRKPYGNESSIRVE